VSAADEAVVVAFNDAINRRDLAALTDLMHDDHRFIDATGASLDGKAACVDAWRGFFEAYPDYRNVFDEVHGDPEGIVHVRGRSECSVVELDGPARWTATVRDARVAIWHVTGA
jgi:ketosteroid isomerase-like protein